MLGHFTAVLSARPVDDNGIDEPSNGCNIPLSDCKGNKLPINYGWMEKGEAQLVGTRHPHRCFAVLTCSILSSSVRFYRTLPLLVIRFPRVRGRGATVHDRPLSVLSSTRQSLHQPPATRNTPKRTHQRQWQ